MNRTAQTGSSVNLSVHLSCGENHVHQIRPVNLTDTVTPASDNSKCASVNTRMYHLHMTFRPVSFGGKRKTWWLCMINPSWHSSWDTLTKRSGGSIFSPFKLSARRELLLTDFCTAGTPGRVLKRQCGESRWVMQWNQSGECSLLSGLFFVCLFSSSHSFSSVFPLSHPSPAYGTPLHFICILSAFCQDCNGRSSEAPFCELSNHLKAHKNKRNANRECFQQVAGAGKLRQVCRKVML